MDWHFRVHQRMAEAERRGQHRSWYVDELVKFLTLSWYVSKY
jgi:pre-mRNA cleavage complex 2 protein Pcf11